MMNKAMKLCYLLLTLSLLLLSCSRVAPPATDSFSQSKNKEIVQLAPRKPTRVTLRRNSSGAYTWALKGEDVGEIIAIDQRLREYVGDGKAAKGRVKQ